MHNFTDKKWKFFSRSAVSRKTMKTPEIWNKKGFLRNMDGFDIWTVLADNTAVTPSKSGPLLYALIIHGQIKLNRSMVPVWHWQCRSLRLRHIIRHICVSIMAALQAHSHCNAHLSGFSLALHPLKPPTLQLTVYIYTYATQLSGISICLRSGPVIAREMLIRSTI